MCVYVCVCVRERGQDKKVRLKVVYKIHDPLPFSLFELVALPISDALGVL